jgi:hypothetical protein
MPEDVTNIIATIQANGQLLRDCGVKRLGLFGSFARGEQRPDSDVDVLVEFEAGKKTFRSFMRVYDILEDTLQHPVDVLTLESLRPGMRERVLKDLQYVSLN